MAEEQTKKTKQTTDKKIEVFKTKSEESGRFSNKQEIDELPFIIDFLNKKVIMQPSTVSAKLDLDLNSSVGSAGAFIQRVITFIDTDATPSVKNANICITTGTTNITDFDDGVLGQTIIIKATNSITVEVSAAVVLNGAGNYAMTDTDTLTLTMFVDQVWTEVARSVN